MIVNKFTEYLKTLFANIPSYLIITACLFFRKTYCKCFVIPVKYCTFGEK